MSQEEFSKAKQTFAEIKKSLEVTKTLQWAPAVDSLKYSYTFKEAPETIAFLNEFFLKMISLLTQQNPVKLGNFEKSSVDDAMILAMKILLVTLPTQTQYLPVLARIFDSTAPYYQGAKLGYTYAAGYPQLRIANAKKFADAKGFKVVVETIQQPDFLWPGVDCILTLLKIVATADVSLSIDKETKLNLLLVTQQKLLSLTDEQLKRENTDVITQMIHVISTLHQQLYGKGVPIGMESFYEFWFENTKKYFSSSSLVLKLFAWEQVNDILADSKSTRPLAESYEVSGAGTEYVNGIYTAIGGPDGDLTTFTKSSTDKSVPMLTLFRCTMRTKAKWWFISQADLVKPGTDKDIDYYLHKSLPDDEREPPTRGWTRINPGIALRGADPPPLFKKLKYVFAKEATRESYLDFKFLKWSTEDDLIGHAFGSSMHREIIARCGKFLAFLAEYEAFTEEHISMIWKAAMHNNDNDIVDEIFAQLIPLTVYLSRPMFNLLIDTALETLQNHDELFNKVAAFTEKFTQDNNRYITGVLDVASSAKLTSFVWAVYTSPGFKALKNQNIVQDLLSTCLQQKGGSAVAMERILECQGTLSKLAEEKTSMPIDEEAAARVIQILQFLLSQHCSKDMIESLNVSKFPESIVGEVHRFATANRSKDLKHETWFNAQLAFRLQVLCKFYTKSAAISIPFDIIESLWNLLMGDAAELDQFFAFLRSGAVGNNQEILFQPSDCLKVFDSFVCNPVVDWSVCGDGAFECFSAFFTELASYVTILPTGTELPPKLGLSTLWRVALDIPSTQSMRSAINILLQAYDTLSFTEENSITDMVQIVFSHLNGMLTTLSSGSSLSTLDQTRISRCIFILTSSLARNKGYTEISHATRSCMSRITLNIYHRKVSSYYNPSQSEMVRVEKGSEGVIKVNLHPFQTVKQLKEKVSDILGYGKPSDFSIDSFSKHVVVTDSTKLAELNVVDGGDLSISYQLTYSSRGFDDDSFRTDDNSSIAQILASDFSYFDCLLNLCESVKDPTTSQMIWQLLMIIPTQVDLMQSVEATCFGESIDPVAGEAALAKPASWEQLLDKTTVARTAYLLQILDGILQPAPELSTEESIGKAASCRKTFIDTGGFSIILNLFIDIPVDDGINSLLLSVVLHIIYYLLFAGAQVSVHQAYSPGGEANNLPQNDFIAPLMNEIHSMSGKVTDKLLLLARGAAAHEESGVVHDALVIITYLIKSPSVASQLTNNQDTKSLISKVLRSGSKRVREMAVDFAVQFGKSQPVVLQWLMDELKAMTPDDENCSEIFSALSLLLSELGNSGKSDLAEIVTVLSDKIYTYPRTKLALKDERAALLGYLELLAKVLARDSSILSDAQIFKLLNSLLEEFLFALPDGEKDKDPICDTPGTRHAAFVLMSTLSSTSADAFQLILGELTKLSKLAARHMHHNWGLHISQDIKRPDMQLSGIKNQGCTCYMNSLLQQLFMSKTFREVILAAPLLEIHRTSLWHRSDEELVGKDLLFEFVNGSWRKGRVAEYYPDTSHHKIVYEKSDGTPEEIALFNIHEGRLQRETGRVRLVDEQVAPDDSLEPLQEREDFAYRVLEQLQRAFLFMKYSKRKYFDARPFVEACKTLNLNFNVYHQNDAAEFGDQLLDRIETATKGKHTKKDIWNDVLLKEVFGGKWLYQKIPQDCDTYNSEKENCGHWQSSRFETFLKVELMIRGKERIEESLEELMQGELMDGDNKIHCDVCTNKMATTRRTCFGALPKTLILHLKRFDLDFQTFETVKLNNRMAFPIKINMFKYTKEGIEEEEKQKQSNSNDGVRGPLEYETNPENYDPTGYDYELQGVLVHAGVAQGGHYYSFIRDTDDHEKWYKFDDEDVTAFAPEHIPVQCFGGPISTSTSGMNNMLEEDRTSNALMLFYTKSAKVNGSSSNLSSPKDLESVSDVLKPAEGQVNGTKAFMREVQESNLQHILSNYLLDPDLHTFVRGLIASVTKSDVDSLSSSVTTMSLSPITKVTKLSWSPKDVSGDLPLQTVQFGCSFLLDVVMHCRERAAMRAAVTVIKEAFEFYPHTAVWFVSHIVSGNSSWFHDFMLTCTDALARGTFVQLVVPAVAVIAPKDAQPLLDYQKITRGQLEKDSSNNGLLVKLVRMIIDYIFRAVNYTRNADELFVLIRDLAGIPSVCQKLQSCTLISFLSYYVMPDFVPPLIQSLFLKHLLPSRQNMRVEYNNLLQSVFEALAALLHVPQVRKVALLQERSYWDTELVVEAREALTIIFNESSHNGGMDVNDIAIYLERVSGTGQKPNSTVVRNFIDRYSTTSDGRLNLEGFLNHHTETASYNPKNVWRDLHAFGFRNDLSRPNTVTDRPTPTAAEVDGVDSTGIEENKSNENLNITEDKTLLISDNCRTCLTNIIFYETGMNASEASARAIAQKICYNDPSVSASLIGQATTKLYQLVAETTWNSHPIVIAGEFVRLLLSIEDNSQLFRLKEVLIGAKFGFINVLRAERQRPSNCRANELSNGCMYDRYLQFLQELISSEQVLENMTKLAETDVNIRYFKGNLKLKPGYPLTENEDIRVRGTTVVVENAGVSECNGDYIFTDLKCNAGYYSKHSEYNGKLSKFTIYKCSLKNGGFQWFLSITPETMEPGTSHDVDFYYALAKANDKLPPTQWARMNLQHVKDPAPTITLLRLNNNNSEDSNDSYDNNNMTYDSENIMDSSNVLEDDEDTNSMNVGDDDVSDTVEDSFVSNNSDALYE